jgi:hypothetical protein
LYNAASIDHVVVLVVGLVVGAVHPVQDVEEAVGAEEEHVVAREVLHLPVPLQHDQLRDDRAGLKVYGKIPKQLKGRGSK